MSAPTIGLPNAARGVAHNAAAYDAGAATYDQRHGDHRSRCRFRIIDRPQLRMANRAARVLELGCGTGRLLEQVRAPVRIGVDVSLAMLRHASARQLAVTLATAHQLPFANGSFDAIIAGKGVFRYLDYPRAFAECARVLAPGGRLGVHQYAAYTRSLRFRQRSSARAESLHVRDLDELYGPAHSAGLDVESTHLWRSVRLPPYAVPVPPWLPGHLWSHCTLILRKARL